jgi:phage gp36-like protein
MTLRERLNGLIEAAVAEVEKDKEADRQIAAEAIEQASTSSRAYLMGRTDGISEERRRVRLLIEAATEGKSGLSLLALRGLAKVVGEAL